MPVDGKWAVEMQSPMGKQTLFFDLKSNGEELVGALTGTDEPNPELLEGKVTGNAVTWKLKVTKPMPIKLKFTATINDSVLHGQVKPGMFPGFPITGRRL
ncbi:MULTISPECIES: hypothetical protein [Microbispora]|uniref:Uncharacterized protein n=5 Tax=Microbispora TaxID=2005 RepID=A0ABY3LNK6_9ACTN|nr:MULTISPECIES: hypothetical protein [Microbispora]KAA9373809.1 hypothetical protein F5972_34185 [Microbispora cellulosiformans]RGA05138.1 hypothetical protein DI270_010055 [Microbispora triticiradicis]TLP52513.1 hypothetical protein FED44_31515 [Microbispora fusca]TYB44476.1 hypothetical protein FXF59_32435 [Microbispora tritici]GIH36968.1 hypothetical protein Mam01_71320 [Microbispora amethystogenes]